jgi:hypothetical protein
VVYGIGRIDASGRIADRAVISALGWRGGDRLTLTADAGVVTARRDLFPHPGQPSGIPVTRSRLSAGPGCRVTGVGCLVAEGGSVLLVSHGQVALHRSLVPRIRRMVALGCSYIPVVRREITQYGGVVPVVCLMVTLIRGLPDRPSRHCNRLPY